jgi:ParB/RepB/Spo0J family partition protein
MNDAYNNSVYEEIDISLIAPDPDQPRKHLVNIEELAESIREQGIIQPPTVRPVFDTETLKHSYVIITGERRYSAAKLIGLTTISCLVREVDNETDILAIQMVENLQDEDMNVLETATGLNRLRLQMGSGKAVSKKIGISESEVSRYNRIYTGGPWTQQLAEHTSDLTALSGFAIYEGQTSIRSDTKAKNLYAKLEAAGFDDLRKIIAKAKSGKRIAARENQKKELETSGKREIEASLIVKDLSDLQKSGNRVSVASKLTVVDHGTDGARILKMVVDNKEYLVVVPSEIWKDSGVVT